MSRTLQNPSHLPLQPIRSLPKVQPQPSRIRPRVPPHQSRSPKDFPLLPILSLASSSNTILLIRRMLIIQLRHHLILLFRHQAPTKKCVTSSVDVEGDSAGDWEQAVIIGNHKFERITRRRFLTTIPCPCHIRAFKGMSAVGTYW